MSDSVSNSTRFRIQYIPFFQGIILVCLCAPPLVLGQVPSDSGAVAEEAIKVFQARCYRCHGGLATSAGLDVLNPESLFGVRGNDVVSAQWIIPGQLENSLLWKAVESGFMPLDDSPEASNMTDSEREVLKRWIESGAAFPKRRNSVHLNESLVLQAMRQFLLAKSQEDRRHFRFFSLAHLHNNPAVSEQELRYHRAALVKVLNSVVSHRRSLIDILPIPITSGVDQTQVEDVLYAIDLRELNWQIAEQWEFIAGRYPYGASYEFAEDRSLREVWNEVRGLLRADLPFIRADWFVVNASQHPIYTRLLELPDTLAKLEQRFGVNIADNIRQGKVARAGFSRSGVSSQNRMIERHEGGQGYFWISYDFKPGRSRGDLARFPLGPRFAENPSNEFAFDHDGGEIIFQLPNGLQGYMLVLGDGRRLDEPAPTDIVFDTSGVTGSAAIVNGISCMNCHARGMITGFRDDVRDAHSIGGDAQVFLELLYRPYEQMEQLLSADRDAYVAAERRLTAALLKAEDIGEPVGKVAQRYFANLDIDIAALELGLPDGNTLKNAILNNRELSSLGLGRLTQEPASTIPRRIWESVDGLSYFQEILIQTRPGSMPLAPMQAE